MRTTYRARPALRHLRERGPRPLTTRELATLAGINYRSVAKIETGERNASPKVSIAIAAALGAERDDLFDPIP